MDAEVEPAFQNRKRQTVVELGVCREMDNKYNLENNYRCSKGNELAAMIQSNKWGGNGESEFPCR